jgi:hypothetical protein
MIYRRLDKPRDRSYELKLAWNNAPVFAMRALF